MILKDYIKIEVTHGVVENGIKKIEYHAFVHLGSKKFVTKREFDMFDEFIKNELREMLNRELTADTKNELMEKVIIPFTKLSYPEHDKMLEHEEIRQALHKIYKEL